MKILFITMTNIGDVVLSTTLLDRILVTHPDAEIDVVAGAKAVELFEGLPNVNRLIPVVKKKYHMHHFYMFNELRHQSYDLIIDVRTPLLGRLLHAPTKILPKKVKGEHKAVGYAKLWPLKDDRRVASHVWPTQMAEEEVLQRVQTLKTGPLIALAPTANWIGKQWPQKNFAEFCQKISQFDAMKNAKFVIFGAEHERKTVADFLESLPQDKVIDLIGGTSLGEAYCWLKNCDVFVGNDSGLAHMAAAADCPTVTLFGPTHDSLYAPISKNGIVIKAPERKRVNLEPSCPKRIISDITPDEVVVAAYSLYNQVNGKEENQRATG